MGSSKHKLSTIPFKMNYLPHNCHQNIFEAAVFKGGDVNERLVVMFNSIALI